MSVRRVSLNEVERLARRVFLALGAGPGCDYEPARAVAWLESRRLPGLEMLLRDRPAVSDAAAVSEVVEGSARTLHIDGHGASGAWLAAAATDWLAANGPRATVRVDAVRSPLWFLPDLALCGSPLPGWMTARDPGGGRLMAAQRKADGVSVALWREPMELSGCMASVTLGCGPRPPGGTAPRATLTARALDARHDESLAGGMEVNDALWCSLYEVARAALVPESETSRARGAGARGQ